MPATTALPNIQQFLDAYAGTLRGEHGPRISARRGGTFDLPGGSSAVLWSQQVRRDQDNFRQVYPDTATGFDANRMIGRRYGVTRITQTFGVGSALLQRATAAAGAGTLYTGTRLLVTPPEGGLPVPYAMAANTDVGASDLSVTVPIRATRPGPGVAVVSARVKLDDALFDATLLPVSITCADGTLEEKTTDYLARGRRARINQRVGYASSVDLVCRAAGAANVVILDAGTFGDDDDFGVTHVYVADQGFSSPVELLDDCALAIENVRVAGCDTQVLGMTITPVTLAMVATLWDNPSKFNLSELRRTMVGALQRAFNHRPDFWTFSLDSLRGEATAVALNAVRSLAVTSTPSPDAPVFVASLPRYTLAPGSVTLSFVGP
jgi:hypothetical protein